MTASDHYWEQQRYDDALHAELAKLRAQIERDRPVIDAARAETQAERVLLRTTDAWWSESADDARNTLAAAQLARVAAVDAHLSAPDEVSEAET